MTTQKKKPTNAQLNYRLANAVLHIDKTKDTKSVYFSDKGLRLTINEDYAIIATGFHRHVFSNMTMGGASRPYIYTKHMIDFALENECMDKDGYSYRKLFETLKAKDDNADFNLATYIDWWLYNIFAPLYSIGESEAESFLVYEDYMHNIARQSVLLEEKDHDVTNKEFMKKTLETLDSFVKDIDERVLFHKLTDEEAMQKEIDALREQSIDETMTREENKDE